MSKRSQKQESEEERIEKEISKFIFSKYQYQEKFEVVQAFSLMLKSHNRMLKDIDFKTFLAALKRMAAARQLQIVNLDKTYLIARHGIHKGAVADVVEAVRQGCTCTPQTINSLKKVNGSEFPLQRISDTVNVLAALGICKFVDDGYMTKIQWDEEQAKVIRDVPAVEAEIYEIEEKTKQMRQMRLGLQFHQQNTHCESMPIVPNPISPGNI